MSLILFVASGIVLLFLLVHKQVELVYGRGLIMKNLARDADVWFHARYVSLKAFVSKLSVRNFVWALNFAFVWLARVFLAFGSYVGKNVRELVAKFAHKEGTLKDSGSASFYLKQIKENKESTQPTTDNTEKK